MKKRIISVIPIVMMVFLVSVCGSKIAKSSQNTDDGSMDEMTTGTEVIQKQDITEKVRDVVKETVVAKEDVASDKTQELQEADAEKAYDIPDWLAAYRDYVLGLEHWGRCSFLYVDEDDIPEFVIDTCVFETGCIILTFHDGELDALQIDGLRFRYIEKKNLICGTEGQAGEYANRVYSIVSGKWTYVAGGKYISEFENGLHIDKYSFEWDGEDVEEAQYWERLNQVFDEEQAIVPKQYTAWNNMLSRIETGDFVWEITEQETEEDDGAVITDFEYSDEYIPISQVDFASYQDELSVKDWEALSSFFPILLDGKTFKAAHCPYPNQYTDDFKEYGINDLYSGWYSGWYQEYTDEFILKKFSLCDLTGDGQKELILYSNFGMGSYFVFHKEGDNFYAVYMPVRWLEFLQKNGIRIGTAGSDVFIFDRLHFLKNVFWDERIAMWDDGYCEIGGEEVSEAEIQSWTDKMIVDRAVWYDARPVKLPDWKAAYLEYMEDYIENYSWQGDIYELTKYSFIYVDDDDIPELVINHGVSISCAVLTFHDGEIDVLDTDRDTVCYIEKKNLLNNNLGAFGLYHDYIYSIKNGKWVYVTGGEFDDYKIDHFTYRWEGEEVAEEVYMARLKAVFDTEQAIEPEMISLQEMLNYLQTANIDHNG